MTRHFWIFFTTYFFKVLETMNAKWNSPLIHNSLGLTQGQTHLIFDEC